MDFIQDWLRHNPKYAHLTSSSTRVGEREKSFTSLVSGYVRHFRNRVYTALQPFNSELCSDTFNRVQDMYLSAARLQPALDLDPDVQTGLGVLLNLSGEFDKVMFCKKKITSFVI